jgi:Zn-dependent metalloprotease
MKQRSIVVLIHMALGLMATTAVAQDRPLDFSGERAVIVAGTPDRGLTAPATASSTAVVAQFLRTRELSAATIDSLRFVAQTDNAPSGMTYLRMEQTVGGLRVPGAYVKAALSKQGELIHLIYSLAEASPLRSASTRVSEQAALEAALRSLYPDIMLRPRFVKRDGTIASFSQDAFFY